MEGYSVKIESCTKELTARERIKLKDTTEAVSLDEATQQGDVVITIDAIARLSVHNEKADNQDYMKTVIIDKDGHKYITGSESFTTSLMEIVDEMSTVDEEYQIRAYRMPSKNYKGKEFLTCSIV